MEESTDLDRRAELTELSLEECWRYLRTEGFGRVAVSVGTTPDIFPVNYCVHHDEIVIRTEAGTKLAAGTLMPMIAFEIDDIDTSTRRGWSVVVKGRGREPSGLDEIMALDDLDLTPWAEGPKSRWLLIEPVQVTGRRVGHDTTP